MKNKDHKVLTHMFPFQYPWMWQILMTNGNELALYQNIALVPNWYSPWYPSDTPGSCWVSFQLALLNLALGNPVTWRHQFEGKSMAGWGDTPWTINMEPKNGDLEDDFSFQRGDFQVNQRSIAGGVCSLFIVSEILEVYITESLESLVGWISDVQLWVCSE